MKLHLWKKQAKSRNKWKLITGQAKTAVSTEEEYVALQPYN
jgi:hypothetical protein